MSRSMDAAILNLKALAAHLRKMEDTFGTQSDEAFNATDVLLDAIDALVLAEHDREQPPAAP